MRILTYNINFSRRARGEFEKYSWTHRKDNVIKYIDEIKPDIVCLQEVHEDYIKDLNKAFQYKYQMFYGKFKTNRCNQFLLTLVKHNIKVLRNVTYDLNNLIETEAKLGSTQCTIVSNILIINNHFHMNLEARLISAKLMKEIINTYVLKKCIMVGDFNAFSDRYGYDQMSTIKIENQMMDATQFAKNEEGKVTSKTFDAYPYDILQESALTSDMSKLDYILVRNIKYENPMIHDKKFNEIYPSDHFPVSIDFEWLGKL